MRFRWWRFAGAALVVLTGCRSFEREQHDGVECMVTRNAFGKPTAIDCNWLDSEGAK